MSQAQADIATPDRRLHPWSWLFVLIQQLKQFVLPLAALLFFGSRRGPGGDWALIGPLIGVGVLVLISVLRYFTYRYRIGRDSLTIREGWLHRSLREIPFARIHNVGLHQSLLHRLFGVAEVRLESAGGQKPEAEMRVLRLDEALALEASVRRQSRAGTVAGDDPHPAAQPAAQGHTLLSLSAAEIIRLGLVSNRGMIVFAAAFGAAWQFFPDDWMAHLVERFGRQLFGYASHLQLSLVVAATAALLLLLLALALLRLLSVLLAFLQYHGFRLSESQHRLTVERGLLTRLRTSVARRRIQAWSLYEGFLHRRFKRRNLRIDTAVAEMQGQGDGRALKELAPIASPDACDALVRHLLPQAQWPCANWLPAARGTAWRLFLPGAVFWLLLASALAIAFGQPLFLLLLLWLPWSAWSARQQARRIGYSVDEQLVAVRGGWWSRWWRFAEIDKLQALRLSRSPLDRRFGTASLWLDTAGATGLAPPLRIRYVPQAQAHELYRQLGQALGRRRLRW
nr:PH domain-containing protein [Pseudoxanthomonas kalamensis]